MSNEPLLTRIRALSTMLAPKPTGMAPQLAPLLGIKAVLFDIYGTLLISASGDIGLDGEGASSIKLSTLMSAAGLDWPHQDAARSLDTDQDQSTGQTSTRQKALTEIPLRERLSQVIQADHARAQAKGIDYPEVDIRAIWARLLAELGLRPSAQQLARIALEYECRVNPVWPMPGLADLLPALRQRGLVLGIVSNAQFYTPLILQAFLGQPPAALGLEPCCSAWSYQLRQAKPSTAIYQIALDGLARRHDIRPEQVLYIGNDRRNDIWPAQQLGLKTALFAGDARSLRLREEDSTLAGVNANALITDLAQVLPLITEQGID
ncbi:MAG: HAD family hydrolase [Halochromatium sp.]|nr:HAD family hydrolase [Halochromatium sp.]